MRKLLFVILCTFLCGMVQAKNDVDYAREAREILLKEKDVGRGSEQVCKDVERTQGKKKVLRRECKTVTWDNVLLAVKQPMKGFRLVMGRMDTCTSFNPTFKITCTRDRLGQTNGLNTCFVVEQPFGYKVYGIRRLGNTPFGRREKVYSPYCDELNTPITISEGRKYLDDVIKEAYDDLRTRQVRSLSFPGKLVVDVVPKEDIHDLALNEHMDEDRFLNGGASPLTMEVYTTLALNQENAYNLAPSSASAVGLLQFTWKTYLQMVVHYPRAGLIGGFFDGAHHHMNAARAAVVLLDYNLSLLQPAEREVVLKDSRMRRGYFASTYNGGPSCPKNVKRKGLCAIQMYRKFGDFAKQNPSRENRIYVEKMYAVAKLRR